jgi:hypothetical protein
VRSTSECSKQLAIARSSALSIPTICMKVSVGKSLTLRAERRKFAALVNCLQEPHSSTNPAPANLIDFSI